MRRTIMHAVTVASLFVMFSCLSAAAQEPDAILTLHTTLVAAGVGYSWGGGLLTFQGKEYSAASMGSPSVIRSDPFGQRCSHKVRPQQASGRATTAT